MERTLSTSERECSCCGLAECDCIGSDCDVCGLCEGHCTCGRAAAGGIILPLQVDGLNLLSDQGLAELGEKVAQESARRRKLT